MNIVILTGRLVRDPEIRYTSATQTAVATFNLAVERDKKDENGQKQADFPRIQTFGRQAEACEKYIKKGSLVEVQGKLKTGSYQNKSGDTVYTTDVVASRVEFLEWGARTTAERQESRQEAPAAPQPEPVQEEIPMGTMYGDGFEALDEDVPF